MASLAKPKRRLFWKYAVILVVLVGGALIVSGLIDLLFTYRDTRNTLADFQREKATAAAGTIEQFFDGIEWQVRQAAKTPRAASSSGLELRRLDYLRLLKHVPAITDLSFVDGTGKERLRVSRLTLAVVGGSEDLSGVRELQQPRAGDVHYSPVYFRDESEPYLTIAVAEQTSDAGVVVAEVNLKFILDVVSRIKVGKAGQAYAVDAQGILVAHPDISLVLRKTNLSSLSQVQAALASPSNPPSQGAAVVVAQSYAGQRVLTTYQPITPLGWRVFVEQPLAEAFAPLYSSLLRNGLLLLGGLALAVLTSLFLARKMVAPIQALQAGAARIGAGALDQSIDVRTGDELEALGEEFNRMTSQLRETIDSLNETAEELQAKVQELQDSRARIVVIQERVRREIAAHLHGRVQGALLVLKSRLQEIVGGISSQPEASRMLQGVVDDLEELNMREISGLSRRLYPAMLRQGLVPALQSLGDQFEPTLTVELELDESLMRQERNNRNLLPEPVRMAAYRIAEETMTNVIKHAKATQVTIRLDWSSSGELHLVLEDNGQGFDVEAAGGGLGLSAMQDYAGAVGGECVVWSSPGKGTGVTAILPLTGDSGSPPNKE